MQETRYQPKPVKRVWIEKLGSSEKRPLGIRTVLDRLIQQAIHQQLSPVWESAFSEDSYGFRPGRSAHDALRTAQGFIKAGKSWVIALDLKSFFLRPGRPRSVDEQGREEGEG